MIDWDSAPYTPEDIHNKDKVIVICEKCGNSREQLFVVAKRKNEHICLSCAKSKNKHGSFKTGDIVEYICIDCGKKQLQQYRAYKFDNWRCHHCAMVQGHKEGKFVVVHNSPSEEGKKRIGELASDRWKDPEYRKKWKESRDKTKAVRSVKSKEIWSDEERLKKLSNTMKLIWERPEYRAIKTIQSRDQWCDDEYIIKQLAGYSDDSREKISITSLNHWKSNYSKMVSIIRGNLARKEVKDKLSKASLEAWGRSEYRRLQSEKSKRLWLDEEYRERGLSILTKLRAESPTISSIHKKLYELLNTIGVEYVEEGLNTSFGPFIFDCLIPSYNLLIEVQGDYWHSLTKNVNNDFRKFEYINNYFPEFKILYVWEHEFKDLDSIMGKLKCRLGLLDNYVDFVFKDINIKLCSYDELKRFLDAYHYIGGKPGSLAVGAYLDDVLVAVSLFTSPLRQNTAGQFGLEHGDVFELSRFCIHPNYHKKNFASWFLARSLKFVDKKLVIAYADSTVGHIGTMYRASNFGLHHVVRPDYWYLSPDNWVLHKRTLYSRAVKAGLSERDFAEKFGFIKKFGGPKFCFTRWLK